MNRIIYDMKEFSGNSELLTDALLILAIDDEERSQYAINHFLEAGSIGKAAIVFVYNWIDGKDEKINTISSIIESKEVQIIPGFPQSQQVFIEQLQKHSIIQETKKIVIDISCIITPYLFLLFKYITMWNKDAEIYAINTIPFDYSFTTFPFTSYRSYYGDLKMEEIYGFGGVKSTCQVNDLFIFVGFEGALALKVVEDIEYENLHIVNALPSYYQKYKDISIINNYQLILSHNCKRLYAPATNPYEVYNLLNRCIHSRANVNIAPLCTKPIAIGICMYALEHDNVRIIYPFSDQYESDNSHSVYKAFTYRIGINKACAT